MRRSRNYLPQLSPPRSSLKCAIYAQRKYEIAHNASSERALMEARAQEAYTAIRREYDRQSHASGERLHHVMHHASCIALSVEH